MTRERTTIGLRLGVALGVAIALLGVGIGVTIASIPASNGSINACYKVSTGALRVIDSSKKCASGEKSLKWNVSGPAGPAGPASLAGFPCAAGDASGSLAMTVNPAGGAVTLVCKSNLTVTSSMTLTKIVFKAGTQPADQTICLNTKKCTGSFPLGTPNVVAEFFATAPFHYVCPGDIAQGNYYDVTHTITIGQCTVPIISVNSVITVTP